MAAVRLADCRVRPGRPTDLEAVAGLARLTGGGFTNLPSGRAALAERIERSVAAFARTEPRADDLFLMVLEHRPSARVLGTAVIFASVGHTWPFYSYKITTIAMKSRELARTFRTRVLHLVNDFDGACEVGGLFLHPEARGGGLGRLLARARYLFMARHRARVADRCLAELRGVLRPDGSSPFWDGLAGRFFGMDFLEADRFNALHGNQFIADLMPKYPVYEALLAPEAAAVIGVEHPDGRAARRMLEREGFRFNQYIDIFDGGPTLDVETDRILTVATARTARVAPHPAPPDAPLSLVAHGYLEDFRVMAVAVQASEDRIALEPSAGVPAGEEVLHVPF
ncbi:MAG: arginine N-succinyltransferase [Sphingomonadaceae bacterium]|uniref:arginine N-succinyltransferase n=1 Tax=Thermaurantiacus sp. TaxID=2820283 RepID=UPI00298EDD68|nr:arginine N-succinyltransferase [Thermaurantiacus sp.]MCS6987318.1 arginine N-succinyltransferase [Sphingomonadaceae bacterium]MDW8414539.1 arginine N-succinyltransferase [Thermaurantiacus sp.]